MKVENWVFGAFGREVVQLLLFSSIAKQAEYTGRSCNCTSYQSGIRGDRKIKRRMIELSLLQCWKCVNVHLLPLLRCWSSLP